MRFLSAIVVISILFFGCIKDSSYAPAQTYNKELDDLSISLSADSIPADGTTKDTINLVFLKTDEQDSINTALLSVTATTSAGTLVGATTQTLTVTPQYKPDTSGRLILTAQIILQSSAKKDTAHLKFSYAGVERDTTATFYTVYPDKLTLSASSLLVAPNFSTEDTIYAQLSRKGGGTPTMGQTVNIYALDATFTDTLGTYRVYNSKSNANGQCYFIFVLGDASINQGIDYIGTINIKGIFSNAGALVADTLQIYSR